MPLLNKTDPALVRVRVAVTVLFALTGVVFAGWVVRIPAVKEQVDASPGELGIALLGVSAGAVLTMTATGRLCARFGPHPVAVACATLLSLSVALPARTHSAVALGLVLVVFGAAYGGLSVAVNSAAVDLVAAVRRPVMPTFHAAFSFGGLLGAGLGALLAPHLSAARHLLLLTALGLVTTAACSAALLRGSAAVCPPEGDTRPASRAGRNAGPDRLPFAVVVFGLIALCTAYGEGALADWGALHLEQDLHTGTGLAAVGYAAFSLAMTAGRLCGTWLVERVGQTAALVGGGLTGAAGMLVGALAPQVWLVLAGFALTGLGLANLFPIAIARAGALAGPRGVAVGSTLGYSGMLVGPPAIGLLAEQVGLPLALTTVPLLAGFAAVIAYVVRGTGTAPADPPRPAAPSAAGGTPERSLASPPGDEEAERS